MTIEEFEELERYFQEQREQLVADRERWAEVGRPVGRWVGLKNPPHVDL